MDLFNTTGTIGTILIAGNSSIFGNMIATLLYLFIFLIAISVLFGIPFEFTIIILIPFILAVSSVYGSFLVVFIALLIFMGLILARNFIFK